MGGKVRREEMQGREYRTISQREGICVEDKFPEES